MSVFVYETAVDWESSDKLLWEIRQAVTRLKRSNPQLADCSLADVTLTKDEATVNVTLFFQS
ncbi:MAG TPA: hypothetical protein GXZ85_02495 [Firmicutes bacterium]|jgi:hypothetical protein|nr:hypothetical protein [Bacillota bacterium]